MCMTRMLESVNAKQRKFDVAAFLSELPPYTFDAIQQKRF